MCACYLTRLPGFSTDRLSVDASPRSSLSCSQCTSNGISHAASLRPPVLQLSTCSVRIAAELRARGPALADGGVRSGDLAGGDLRPAAGGAAGVASQKRAARDHERACHRRGERSACTEIQRWAEPLPLDAYTTTASCTPLTLHVAFRSPWRVCREGGEMQAHYSPLLGLGYTCHFIGVAGPLRRLVPFTRRSSSAVFSRCTRWSAASSPARAASWRSRTGATSCWAPRRPGNRSASPVTKSQARRVRWL